MNLRLMTNGQDRLRRFKLNWVSVEPDCGGFVRGSHGTITSPNYPNGYPHNRDCLSKIIGEWGKRIQFHFAAMDIEQHANCSYDYLKISDGVIGSSSARD